MTANPTKTTPFTRGRVVLLAMAGAAVVLGASALTWIHVGTAAVEARLSGSELIPALTPVALAALAGAFALSLSDGWTRRVVAVVVLGCGLLMLALIGSFQIDPTARVQGHRDRDRPGMILEGAVTTAPAGPLLAAAGACVVVVGAGLTLRHGSAWPTRSSRQVTSAGGRRGTSDWDALSAGEDPT